MKGDPMRIHLKEGAQPFKLYSPRVIPLAYATKAKAELDTMVEQGIIQRVGDEPSEWCHPMVVVGKPNGDVRITVDLTKLNKFVSRPAHPFPTPLQAARQIGPGSKFFTTLDCIHGYWQIPLDEDASPLTTFITPYGRYRFLRGPMGFISTGDEFCRRGDIALNGLPNVAKVVDDILTWSKDYGSHLQSVHDILMRCRKNNITLNADKFHVAASSVKFCGYQITADGLKADKEKVKAILDFPVPSNITDLRSFLGLVNQLAEFTPDVAASADILRTLLKPKNVFLWTRISRATYTGTL